MNTYDHLWEIAACSEPAMIKFYWYSDTRYYNWCNEGYYSYNVGGNEELFAMKKDNEFFGIRIN